MTLFHLTLQPKVVTAGIGIKYDYEYTKRLNGRLLSSTALFGIGGNLRHRGYRTSLLQPRPRRSGTRSRSVGETPRPVAQLQGVSRQPPKTGNLWSRCLQGGNQRQNQTRGTCRNHGCSRGYRIPTSAKAAGTPFAMEESDQILSAEQPSTGRQEPFLMR